MSEVEGDVAVKDLAGKPDVAILPYVGLEAAAEAFAVGEIKYGRYNYCKPGLTSSDLAGAIIRHTYKWLQNIERDPDGQLHLGSVIAGAMMILDKQRLGTLVDDRYTIPVTTEDQVYRLADGSGVEWKDITKKRGNKQ
jgi:hypothetical protein